jgi:hypothetical protein
VAAGRMYGTPLWHMQCLLRAGRGNKVTGAVDGRCEARNAELAKQDFSDYPHIHVPEVYWGATRRRVMTMEWIDGVRLSDLTGLREQGFNISQVPLPACAQYLCQSSAVLFRPRRAGKIGLLDERRPVEASPHRNYVDSNKSSLVAACRWPSEWWKPSRIRFSYPASYMQTRTQVSVRSAFPAHAHQTELKRTRNRRSTCLFPLQPTVI